MSDYDPQTGEVLETQAIVRSQPQGGALLFSGNPREARDHMVEVAKVLAEIIEARKLYTLVPQKAGQDGKPKPPKKHVHIEGWTLLGSLLNTMVRTTACDPVLAPDGKVLGFKATSEVLRGDSVIGGAVAFCMKSETRGPWKYADDYALASMAQTRAASKALRLPLGFVMELAGFDSLPSDEVPPGGFQPVPTSKDAPRDAIPPKPDPGATEVPKVAAVDEKGRPVKPAGSYHECPSCHAEAVLVSPEGDAFCWKKAKGCGAKFLHKIWQTVKLD